MKIKGYLQDAKPLKKKGRPVQVTLSQEEYTEAKIWAEEKGLSVSQYMKMCLKGEMKKRRSDILKTAKTVLTIEKLAALFPGAGNGHTGDIVRLLER